jgi:hypothetical protein
VKKINKKEQKETIAGTEKLLLCHQFMLHPFISQKIQETCGIILQSFGGAILLTSHSVFKKILIIQRLTTWKSKKEKRLRKSLPKKEFFSFNKDKKFLLASK